MSDTIGQIILLIQFQKLVCPPFRLILGIGLFILTLFGDNISYKGSSHVQWAL